MKTDEALRCLLGQLAGSALDLGKRELRVFLAMLSRGVDGNLRSLSPATTQELVDVTGLHRQHLSGAIKGLVAIGLLVKTSEGVQLAGKPSLDAARTETVHPPDVNRNSSPPRTETVHLANRNGSHGRTETVQGVNQNGSPEGGKVAMIKTVAGQIKTSFSGGSAGLAGSTSAALLTASKGAQEYIKGGGDDEGSSINSPTVEINNLNSIIIYNKDKENFEEKVTEMREDLNASIERAVDLMVSGGYTPPRQGDVRLVFKGYISAGLLKKHSDAARNFDVDKQKYLNDFIIPALRDCPKKYRSVLTTYQRELNYKLAINRQNGSYENHWKEQAVVIPVSDFSSQSQDTICNF